MISVYDNVVLIKEYPRSVEKTKIKVIRLDTVDQLVLRHVCLQTNKVPKCSLDLSKVSI